MEAASAGRVVKKACRRACACCEERRPYSNQLLAEADCIWYLGTKVNSLTTLKGEIPATGKAVTVIQLDADPAELGNNVPTKSELDEVPPVYAWQSALQEQSS